MVAIQALSTHQRQAPTKKAVAKKAAGSKEALRQKPKATKASNPVKVTPQKRKAPEQPTQAPAKRQRAAKPTLQPISHPSHGTVPAHLFLWGDGGCGQLGMGDDVVEKYRPALLDLPGGKKAVQIACGGMHTVALAEDGTVYTWGVNDEGALGRETEGELWQQAPEATGAHAAHQVGTLQLVAKQPQVPASPLTSQCTSRSRPPSSRSPPATRTPAP